MAQMVFEFGCEGIDPVIRAVKMSIGSSRYRVMTMSTDTDQSLDSQDSLEEAGTKAKTGLLSSITLYPDHPWIQIAVRRSGRNRPLPRAREDAAEERCLPCRPA